MLLEEFIHSMEYIQYEFKKFYKKNHSNIDLVFKCQENFE